MIWKKTNQTNASKCHAKIQSVKAWPWTSNRFSTEWSHDHYTNPTDDDIAKLLIHKLLHYIANFVIGLALDWHTIRCQSLVNCEWWSLVVVGRLPLKVLEICVFHTIFMWSILWKYLTRKVTSPILWHRNLFNPQVWKDSSNGMNYISANIQPMHKSSRV